MRLSIFMFLQKCLRPMLIFILSLCFSSFSHAEIAEAQHIFKCQIKHNKDYIQITWHIAPKHFLYKDRIQISINQHALKPIWPSASVHKDKLGQMHAVYRDQLTLEFKRPRQKIIQIDLNYQGCSDAGLCYPPQYRHEQLMKSDHSLIWTLLSFLGLGLLLAFTPCVLPMLPILSQIVLGQSNTKSKSFKLGSAYVLGMASSYALVGAIIAQLGHNLFIQMQNPYILFGFAVFFILMGISSLGWLELKLPYRLQHKGQHLRQKLVHGDYITAWLMGSLAILVLSPCVTAPMLGALAYITQLGQVWQGSLCLFMLGLGMGLPLLLVAVSANHWLPKAGAWMETVRSILAIMLFGLAYLLLARIANPFWQNISLLTFLILTCYLLRPRAHQAKWSKYLRSLSLVLLISSSFIWFIKNTSATPPATLPHLNISHRIKYSQKPIILYFSAQWCLSCQYLEKNVWSRPELALLYKNNEWIKIDLTHQTPENKQLMRRFKVIAPPSVIRIKHGETSALNGEEINLENLNNWRY